MSSQEPISTQDQGSQRLVIRHPSGATVYAEIPAQAEADAPFIHAWIRNQQSDRTQEAYAANVSRFYREVRKPLSAVTLFDLQDYGESLYDLAPASQVLLLRCVKSALSFCYQVGHLKINVGAALRLGKPEEKLAQRILSEAQGIKLIAMEQEPRNHLLLLVLFKAGLRAAEACDLQKHDLQENRGSCPLERRIGRNVLFPKKVERGRMFEARRRSGKSNVRVLQQVRGWTNLIESAIAHKGLVVPGQEIGLQKLRKRMFPRF